MIGGDSSVAHAMLATQEAEALKSALQWVKTAVVIVAVIVFITLGTVLAVGVNSEQQNQKTLTQIDATVTSHNTELAQTLKAACILIDSSTQLKPYAPTACKGVAGP